MNNNLISKVIFFFLFLALVWGSVLRLYSLNDRWLWQDEAELALYARQILDGKLPQAQINGRDVILYIGVLLPFSEKRAEFGYVDPQIYNYYQEDYAENGRLVKHPFGDILLTSISHFFLGDSIFSTRLPFAMLGIFSLFFTFELGKLLYNSKIAMMATAFQSLNIALIFYERQARYYSPSLFFFLGTVYFGLKALTGERRWDYLGAALFYVALAITMPLAAIAAPIILVSYSIYSKRSWHQLVNKNLLVAIGFIIVCMIQYLFLYQPWTAFNADVVELSLATKYFRSIVYLISLGLNMPFYLVAVGMILIICRRSKSDVFVLLAILVPALIYPLIMVSSSFYERMYLNLVPFYGFAAAICLDSFYLFLNRKFSRLSSTIVLVLLLSCALVFPKAIFSYGINVNLDQYPWNLKRWPFLTTTTYRMLKKTNFEFMTKETKDTLWVEEAYEFLRRKQVRNDEWVFMTIQNTTLLYHTDLKAQLIWPVKKSYLNTIQDRFWILIDPEEVAGRYSMGNFFYGIFNPPEGSQIQPRHYEERIKSCRKHVMPSGAWIHECNAE